MIKLEFTVGGQVVKLETESIAVVSGLLKTLETPISSVKTTAPKAQKVVKKAKISHTRARSTDPKAYAPWTKTEIKALIEARGKKMKTYDMIKLPELEGRGINAAQQMLGYVKHPNHSRTPAVVKAILREINRETPVSAVEESSRGSEEVTRAFA